MAIRGSLKEASLPDVLQLLAMGKKTGCLSVGHRGSFGYIFFDRGKISYAVFCLKKERPGDMLGKNETANQDHQDRAGVGHTRHPPKNIRHPPVKPRAM